MNENIKSNTSGPGTSLPGELATHRGFSRVFQPGKLTFGFIAPLEGYPDSPGPSLADHAAMAQKVDQMGMAALWLRDVPFYDPDFGDVGQILDPMVYAGWLAAVTRDIAIGTAGIVAPLRHPLLVAKQAATVDQLLGGRFLLGLAGGDRPTEFPAFGLPYVNRAERYREARGIIRAVTEDTYPVIESEHYGNLRGQLDMVPRPLGPKLPTIAIGRGGQSVEWIAKHMDAWIWAGFDARTMTDVIPRWRAACAEMNFKPYGYGTLFDLHEDPDAPVQPGRVLRAGRNTLIEFWKMQEEAGVAHVGLHMKPTRRPASDILDELAEFVLPHFPTHKREV